MRSNIFRHTSVKLLLLILGGVFLICTLALLANKRAKGGNFERLISSKKAQLLFGTPKSQNISLIAGIIGDNIFIQNSEDNSLVILNDSLTVLDTVKYNLPKGNFEIIIDSDANYYVEKNRSYVIKQSSNTKSTIDTVKLSNLPITRIIKFDASSFVFRSFDTINQQVNQKFFKKNISNNTLLEEKNISVFQNDAGIMSDGILSFDVSTKQLAYVFFYQNKILHFDTSLTLIKETKTIDKFDNPTTTAAKVDSSGFSSYTTTSPLIPVNKYMCTYDGIIYVCSAVKALNETQKDATENLIIDKYSTKTGTYLGSFYVPKFRNQNGIYSFQVLNNNRVLILFEDFIVLYSF